MLTSTDLCVGDRIKDNDPRMPTRVLTVTQLLPGVVMAEAPRGGRVVKIRSDRIFMDDKPRRKGFSRIPLAGVTDLEGRPC